MAVISQSASWRYVLCRTKRLSSYNANYPCSIGTPEDGVLTRVEGDSAAHHPLRNWWIDNVGTDLKDPMVKADLEDEINGGVFRFDGTDAATLTWSMRRVEVLEEP